MRASTAHRTASAVSIGFGVFVAGLLAATGVAHGAPDAPDAPSATTVAAEPPDEPVPESTVPGSLIPPVSWNPGEGDPAPTTTQPAGSPSPAARRGTVPGGEPESSGAPVSTAGVASASFPGTPDGVDDSSLPVTGTDDVGLGVYLAGALLAGGLALVGISRRGTDRT